MWDQFGFRDSPYATEPVPPTRAGDHILVGRQKEISMLESRVLSCGNHPTLEGDNGVGKTSLLSVACYRLRLSFDTGQSSKLFIPLANFFQPTSADSVDDFVKKVYYEVASTIVAEHETLKKHAAKVPKIADVKTWLNSPLLSSFGGSVSVGGFGGGVNRGYSANGSEGFADAGFRSTIDVWLREIFPTSQAGGFICVIDNLELLKTTQNARNLLEALRDPLFNRRGLRWILCGARGIMRTSVSSPRLEGRIADPIAVSPISDGYVAAAVKRRIECCRTAPGSVAPVGPETFRYLYDILNRNLRNAFKHAEDFSLWLLDERHTSGNPEEYTQLFEIWLTSTTPTPNWAPPRGSSSTGSPTRAGCAAPATTPNSVSTPPRGCVRTSGRWRRRTSFSPKSTTTRTGGGSRSSSPRGDGWSATPGRATAHPRSRPDALPIPRSCRACIEVGFGRSTATFRLGNQRWRRRPDGQLRAVSDA
jgi:hypothetical protein